MTERRTFDPLVDEVPSRYVVGIDLGTTNSAVAYVDTKSKKRPRKLQVFPLPQLVAPGEVEALETLPSFHYEPSPVEVDRKLLRLPWEKNDREFAVGTYARNDGLKSPDRLIASAKSWLCHSGVDRTAALLPWHGAGEVECLSPVDVSARYLQHIHDAWNAKFRQEPLAEQEIVLTIPASFDEVARELTVGAAKRAGLSRVVLIEEPQAAFYEWVYKHADDWQERVEAGQKILVCDIGGGTTDFTLIRVRSNKSDDDDEKVQFHRVAVGDHLILGGDNLDLALARHLEAGLEKKAKLDPRQWDVLVRSCRRLKEDLLSEHAPPKLTLNLPSSGSKLIGGGLQVEVKQEEVAKLLVKGFLPTVKLDESPIQRQSGFQEFGLPYAADPAITRHLAAFLSAHQENVGDHHPARPDVVLFNGGFFASSQLRERLLEVLCKWFNKGRSKKWSPIVLENDRLDLAVARGAAYFGMVRRGEGVRIAASLARSYYIGVESNEPSAVCLVPGNAEPGENFEVANRDYELTISQPVEFPLFVSSTRLTDQPGEIIQFDREALSQMPPIRTVIRSRSRNEKGTVSVHLNSRLTEIGTIELWCSEVGTERRWRLQFDVRSATQTDVEEQASASDTQGLVDESLWDKCYEKIAEVFSQDAKEMPAGLPKRLAKALETSRNQWPMTLLRRIWDTLIEFEAGRKRSVEHEARWLNLLGYSLRPGYGLAVDDWRVTETWRTAQGKLKHYSPTVRAESLILWRRIAGGLSSGQQRSLAEPWISAVRNLHRQRVQGKGRGSEASLNPSDSSEVWHLLGSLELLPVPLKVEMGNILLELIPRKKFETARSAMLWALGRLGQRVPIYGPLNTVVQQEVAAKWLETIVERDHSERFVVMQLARRTADRYRDLSEQSRLHAIDWLKQNDASKHMVELVQKGGKLDSDEQNQVFGEALPKGLRIP